MNKYEKGMKAGAKPFESISRECAEKIDTFSAKMGKDVKGIQQNINDIIDIIAEEDPLNRKEIIENLKNHKNEKPDSFSIRIIYVDEYKELADNMRKSFNQMGNAASMQTYEDFRSYNILADHYFLIGRTTDVTEAEILLNANGCSFVRNGKMIYVNINKIDFLNNTEWEVFKSYYKQTSEKAITLDQSIKNAENASKKKRKRDEQSSKAVDGILDIASKFIDKILEKTGEWPLLFELVFGLPLVLASALLSTLIMIASLPVGISIEIVNMTLNDLDKKSNKAIYNAQQQIVLAKATEYIRNKQLYSMITLS